MIAGDHFATAVAFPNEGRIVLARFVASFLAAILVGTWWARRSKSSLLKAAGHLHDDETGSRWRRAPTPRWRRSWRRGLPMTCPRRR